MTQTDQTDESQSPEDVFWTAVGVEAGLGGIALLLGWLIGPDARALLPTATPAEMSAIAGGLALGVLATIPLLVLMAVVRHIDHPAIKELEKLGDHPMIRMMLRLSPGELLAISLCAGVGEELLFRGWLMPLLSGPDAWVDSNPEGPVTWWALGGWLGSVASDTPPTGLWSWWSSHGGISLSAGLFVSSLAFGLFHPITKLYIGLTAVMGLYFGLLLILTGNLLVPIVAHGLYDAVQLWGAAKQLQQEEAV